MNLRGYCSISSPTFLQLCQNFYNTKSLEILEFLQHKKQKYRTDNDAINPKAYIRKLANKAQKSS